MSKILLILPVLLLSAGCSSDQLARLAPPGILKYEEIASEKPANPAIVEEIENRKEDRKARFPNLSEAPQGLERPEDRSVDAVEADIDALAAARDALQTEVGKERAATADDRSVLEQIEEERDALEAGIDADATAVEKDLRQQKQISEDGNE